MKGFFFFENYIHVKYIALKKFTLHYHVQDFTTFSAYYILWLLQVEKHLYFSHGWKLMWDMV